MTILIIFLLFAIKLYGPEYRTLIIIADVSINPYEALFKAVCAVESSGDPLAYNKAENAVGIAQIRQIRIKDYNQRTGHNYKLVEMFNPEKAKSVFLYYASRHKPCEYEHIARSWNGSGPMTVIYWNKVISKLNIPT